MKKLELKEITLILTGTENEFSAHKYPGPGAYLLQDGRLAIVYATGGAPCVTVVPTSGLPISEEALAVGEALTPIQGGTVDPHKLVDQITELVKVMKA